MIWNLPQNSVYYHNKHFLPLSLQGVYSFILYVNFHSKMQKKAKNSTATLKNSTDASALSARFSNYASNYNQVQTQKLNFNSLGSHKFDLLLRPSWALEAWSKMLRKPTSEPT